MLDRTSDDLPCADTDKVAEMAAELDPTDTRWNDQTRPSIDTLAQKILAHSPSQVDLAYLLSSMVGYKCRHGVRACLQCGADPNLWVQDTLPAIFRCLDWPDIENTRAITAASKNLNEMKGDKTPLLIAVDSFRVDHAIVFLDAGANFECVDDKGTSLLVYAVRRAMPDLLTELLRRGADPTRLDPVTNQPPVPKQLVPDDAREQTLAILNAARGEWHMRAATNAPAKPGIANGL